MRTGGWSMKATVEYTRARGRLERSVEKANKTININREGFRISLFSSLTFPHGNLLAECEGLIARDALS